MSGQDILDQAAGTTAVRARLPAHRLGRLGDPERQGHRRRAQRGRQPGHGRDRRGAARPLRPGRHFEDQVTPIGPATAAFTDDSADTDALTVADGGYKVVFLAFPMEAYGSATQKADLMNRALTWFGS